MSFFADVGIAETYLKEVSVGIVVANELLKEKQININARIEAMVLGSLVPISKAEICNIYPNIIPTTIEAVLGRMVKAGQIQHISEARAARSVRNE